MDTDEATPRVRYLQARDITKQLCEVVGIPVEGLRSLTIRVPYRDLPMVEAEYYCVRERSNVAATAPAPDSNIEVVLKSASHSNLPSSLPSGHGLV